MTDTEPMPGVLPGNAAEIDGSDPHEGIRDRSVREVVERTRDVIRRTRELLDNSRELLDRVRHRGDGDPDAPGGADMSDDDLPGEHDADEASGSHAGVDAWPVDGRA